MNDSPLPSLNPRTRAIVDEFNDSFAPGVTGEQIIKKIIRKYNSSWMEIRKIFKTELNIDISKKDFYKRIHITAEMKASREKTFINTKIISGEEKIK